MHTTVIHTPTADDNDDTFEGLFFDSSGDIVHDEGEFVCEGSNLDAEGEAENEEWTESQLHEFADFLSNNGVDDPMAVLEIVPDGVTLMTFAHYYIELNDAQRARLRDGE